jgi:hypothetical protein
LLAGSMVDSVLASVCFLSLYAQSSALARAPGFVALHLAKIFGRSNIPRLPEVTSDVPGLDFSLAIAAVCAVLFGSASAMSAARENVGAENAIDKQVGHANGCVSISPWHN